MARWDTVQVNFANAERYRPGPAKEAWDRMLAFLGRHVPAGR